MARQKRREKKRRGQPRSYDDGAERSSSDSEDGLGERPRAALRGKMEDCAVTERGAAEGVATAHKRERERNERRNRGNDKGWLHSRGGCGQTERPSAEAARSKKEDGSRRTAVAVCRGARAALQRLQRGEWRRRRPARPAPSVTPLGQADAVSDHSAICAAVRSSAAPPDLFHVRGAAP